MSTKINVRSPYYLSYSEPPEPLPVFDCGYANAVNFSVDESGTISLPTLDYGAIESYTSAAADFSNGTFNEVSSDTLRTLKLTIIAPEGFSNQGDGIICEVTATQPLKPVDCPTVVSPSGSIPSQALNTGGSSVTIDYSSYFTGTTSDFTDYLINNNGSYLDVSINRTDEEITITSKSTAGVFSIQLERIDNSTSCSAKQTISTTLTSLATFNCTTANLLGGAIAADGSLTTPSSIGTITATKETSGGASVTSIAANNTGSDISVTLYYDVLVPAGYSNSGSTIECNVTYTQRSNIITPTFTCSDVDLDDQAILVDGNVTAGVAKYYGPNGREYLTIESFTPTNFPQVSEITRRDVTYTIEVPSGFTNTGSTIDCVERIKQPAADIPSVHPCDNKINAWYIGTRTVDVYTQFVEKNIQYCIYKVFAEDVLAPSSAWEGKQLCLNGSIVQIPNGNHTYIRSTKGSVFQGIVGTFEYVIVFGSANTIKAVYLKDWNTKQLRRL
jgi:hypothetical protein